MSWADDNGIDGYWGDEILDDAPKRIFYVLGNGTKICSNCGSKNIKTSTKGNEYCADLCWLKEKEL